MTWSVGPTETSKPSERQYVVEESFLFNNTTSVENQPATSLVNPSYKDFSPSTSGSTDFCSTQRNHLEIKHTNDFESQNLSNLTPQQPLDDFQNCFSQDPIWNKTFGNSNETHVSAHIDRSHSVETRVNISNPYQKNDSQQSYCDRTPRSMLNHKQRVIKQFSNYKNKVYYQQQQSQQPQQPVSLTRYQQIPPVQYFHNKSLQKKDDTFVVKQYINETNVLNATNEKKGHKVTTPTGTTLAEHHDILVYDKQGRGPLSIFVGNIPFTVTLNAFYKQMQLRGQVIDIACDFRKGAWMTAFVTFSKTTEAGQAIEALNNRRIFKNTPPHRLVSCFAPHPPPSLLYGLSHVQNNSRKGNQPNDKSFWILPPYYPQFDNHSDPQRHANINPRFSLLRDGPPGANLFVYGIPSDWSEVTLMRLCQEFGHIVGIRVPLGITSGAQRLNKGFGFVSYDSTESSSRAFVSLSGREILGKSLIVQVKSGERLPSLPLPLNMGLKPSPLSTSKIDYYESQTDDDSRRRHQRKKPYMSKKSESARSDFSPTPFLCTNETVFCSNGEVVLQPNRVDLDLSTHHASDAVDRIFMCEMCSNTTAIGVEYPQGTFHQESTSPCQSFNKKTECATRDSFNGSVNESEHFLLNNSNTSTGSLEATHYHVLAPELLLPSRISPDEKFLGYLSPRDFFLESPSLSALEFPVNSETHKLPKQWPKYNFPEEGGDWRDSETQRGKEKDVCQGCYIVDTPQIELSETQSTTAVLDPRTPVSSRQTLYNTKSASESLDTTPPKIVPLSFFNHALRQGPPIVNGVGVKSYDADLKTFLHQDSVIQNAFDASKSELLCTLPYKKSIESFSQNQNSAKSWLCATQTSPFNAGASHPIEPYSSLPTTDLELSMTKENNKISQSNHLSLLSSDGNISPDSMSTMSNFLVPSSDSMSSNKGLSEVNGNSVSTPTPSVYSAPTDTISLFCNLVERYLRIS